MRLPREGRLSKFKEKGFGSLSARDKKFFPHVSPGPESFQKGMYSVLRKASPPSKAMMKGSCVKYEQFSLLSLRRERMSELGESLCSVWFSCQVCARQIPPCLLVPQISMDRLLFISVFQ